MKTVRSLDNTLQTERPVLLAIGMFDGLHIGHQQLMRAVTDEAEQCRGESWVLTFDRHPLQVLHPASAPAMILQVDQKAELLEQMELDGVFLVPFTAELASCSPSAFVDRLTRAIPSLSKVVVGADWRFGKGASGTPDDLRDFGRDSGFEVEVIKPVLAEAEKVSSTRIRAALAAGLMREAMRMLGRPYQVRGRVIPGDQEGRTLGYPTANVDVVHDLIPPPGIYATRVLLDGVVRDAAGYRSTVRAEDASRVFEVHLFDCADDLYGKEVRVDILERIRDDHQFESKTDLMQQIATDLGQIQHFLATH